MSIYINGQHASQKDLTAFLEYIRTQPNAQWKWHYTRKHAVAIVTEF